MLRFFVIFSCSFLLVFQVCAADYIIGKGDGLEVAVWGIPEMSRTVTVRPDGKITLPAVGDVVAAGVTPEKLSLQLADAMKSYVKQPIVTVSVERIVNNRIYITGGLLSRSVDLVKETSLLKLMSEIGNLTAADLHNAYILRNKKKISTDFYALYYKGDLAQDLTLQAEDIIFLPSNLLNQVYVFGAVKAPQSLQYYDGMRIMDAILAAGGFTEFAKQSSVYRIDKNRQKQKIDLEKLVKGKDMDTNINLAPGDYIIVDESIF